VSAAFSIPKLVSLWVVLMCSGAIVLAERASRRLDLVGDVGTPERALGVFLLLNVVAFALSIDHRQSLIGERLQYQGFLTTLLYAGYFWLGRIAFDEERRFHLLLWALAIGAMGVSAYAVMQKGGLDPIWGGYLPQGRVFSSIGHPNALGAYLVLAIPVSLGLLPRAGGWARLVLILGITAMVAALFFTQSRGGGVGLVVALAILGGMAVPAGSWTRLRRYLVSAGAVAAIVVAASVVLSLFLPVVRSAGGALWRGANAAVDVFQDRSAQRHLSQWLVGIHIVVDHPLFGAGQDTYALLFPEYKEQVLPPERARAFDPYRVESPHNVYIAIAGGAGIPALAAYGVLVGTVLFTVVRAIRRETDRHTYLALSGILGALGGHLVTDLFMTADLTGSWMFWLLMGAGLGFTRRRMSDLRRDSRRHGGRRVPASSVS
jgi:O-antigen ligase